MERIMHRLRGDKLPKKHREQHLANTEKHLKDFETQLAGKTYFFGDSLTILDFFMPVLLFELDLIGFKFDTNYPNLKKYYKNLGEEVPAIGMTLKRYEETFGSLKVDWI